MSAQPPIDILSLIHFIQYIVFGIFLKDNYILALLIGILWEIYEYFVTTHPYTKQLLIRYWPIPQRYWDERNINNKYADIMINMLGYYIGNQITIDQRFI
jgi:hypothetical protein